MTHPEHIRFLNPSTLAPTPGYSQVVSATGGKTIYLSGQIALDASRNLIGAGDFRAQAQQVFENLKAGLAAAGADFNHVVKLNIFLQDRADLPVLREVRDRYVNTETPPASTAVVVQSLAQEEFLLEVEAIAVLAE